MRTVMCQLTPPISGNLLSLLGNCLNTSPPAARSYALSLYSLSSYLSSLFWLTLSPSLFASLVISFFPSHSFSLCLILSLFSSLSFGPSSFLSLLFSFFLYLSLSRILTLFFLFLSSLHSFLLFCRCIISFNSLFQWALLLWYYFDVL